LQLKKPLSDESIRTTLAGIVLGKDIPNAERLPPLNDLSDYFPEAPAKRMVHLIVEVPSGESPAVFRPATTVKNVRPSYHVPPFRQQQSLASDAVPMSLILP